MDTVGVLEMSEHDFCPICDLDLRWPWDREGWDDGNHIGEAGDTLMLEHFDKVRLLGRHDGHRHLMDSPDVMRLRDAHFRAFRPLREILADKP